MTLKTNFKRRLFLLFFLFSFALYAQSQSFEIAGTMVDKETQMPISGVLVRVNNAVNEKEVVEVVTNKNGSFVIPNLLSNKKYSLKASFMGYSDLIIPVEGMNKKVDLGKLSMIIKHHLINEVVITSNASTAIQKGDTIEMNANAFKTTADASAEDLVMKMPGISMENGSVVAHG